MLTLAVVVLPIVLGGCTSAVPGQPTPAIPVATTAGPTTQPTPTAPLTTALPTTTPPTPASPPAPPPTTTQARTKASSTAPTGTTSVAPARSPTTTVLTTAGPATADPSAAVTFGSCGLARAATATANCLRESVSAFWSGELNQAVDQPVIVGPSAGQVPGHCRPALALETAFTCQENDTVYLTAAFMKHLARRFSRDQLPYAIASVVAHEIGHVVQAAVKQPGYAGASNDQKTSRMIEQQADCLGGVWAHSQSTWGHLIGPTYRTVATALITDISSNPEIATHGTPPERSAAIERGLAGGRPQSCGLATFS